MASSSFTFKDASGATQTAFAVLNAGLLVPGAILTDAVGAVLIGQKAMASSLPVALASDQSAIPLSAGEAHIGAVGGKTVVVKVTPTLTVHATYVSGDYVGTSATAMVFAGMARSNGGTGVIITSEMIDLAVQSVAGELWLFDTAITPPADSAAWSISDADVAHCVGVIAIGTYYASALNSVAFAANVGLAYQCAVADTALYGCWVTRGAPAYASGDISLVLKALLD